jgi:hypothetical protein
VQARLLVVLIVLVTLAAPGAANATARSDSSAVTALLKRETVLFNARQWQQLWRLYTPSFRSSCAYTRWRAANANLRAQTGPVTAANISVRVSGTRAVARYAIRARGQVLGRVTDDVYRKIGAKWLDEETDCP